MAMSISPAQLILPVASLAGEAVPRRSASSVLPADSPAAISRDPSPAPAATPTPQFSTDMRVDDQHQVYYEFVDDRTGDVLFEIPPEALREIGESLNLPLDGGSRIHSVDVKS